MHSLPSLTSITDPPVVVVAAAAACCPLLSPSVREAAFCPEALALLYSPVQYGTVLFTQRLSRTYILPVCFLSCLLRTATTWRRPALSVWRGPGPLRPPFESSSSTPFPQLSKSRYLVSQPTLLPIYRHLFRQRSDQRTRPDLLRTTPGPHPSERWKWKSALCLLDRDPDPITSAQVERWSVARGPSEKHSPGRHPLRSIVLQSLSNRSRTGLDPCACRAHTDRP